jgi:hypothetical protein
MNWLWTWGGKCFGYPDGDNLWSHDGRHVGSFHDDEIYAADGRYLGKVMGSRLITDKSYTRVLYSVRQANGSRQACGLYRQRHVRGLRGFPEP